MQKLQHENVHKIQWILVHCTRNSTEATSELAVSWRTKWGWKLYTIFLHAHFFFSPTDVYYTTEFVFYVAGKCYDKNIDPSQQKIYRGRASLSTRWQHAIWWWWQENTCVASTMTRLQTSHDTRLACHAYCACGCQHAFVFHSHMHATSATT